MKQVFIECRQYNEWDEKTQSVILEKNREINLDYEWWEFVYEDAKNVGIEITSFDLDRNKHCKGEFTSVANEIATNIINEHGESCNTYKIAQSFINEWQPIFNDYMNSEHISYESRDSEEKMIELESQFHEDILNEYANILQREYEYRYSNEAIAETLIINEYEFDCNGKMW